MGRSVQAFAADFGIPCSATKFGSTAPLDGESGVYNIDESPAHQHIPLHNEQAYTRDWR